MRLYSIWLLLFATAVCGAGVINVPSQQYPSIQQAINLAANGDIIIVAPGRYFENINFFGKAIIIRSQDPNDSNIVSATIIEGNRPADVNFASVVTFKNGETANSILEGFTITGGSGSWLQIYWEFKGYLWNRCGGGILCANYSAPTIRKNIITGNFAGEGGGIYCYNHSNATITDNRISDNNALINHGFPNPDPNDSNIYDNGDGGAIVGFQYCDLTIKNNIIRNNRAQYYGGGIHMRQWSNGLIENNLITQNSSNLGGGIHITYTSAPTVRKNTITANTTSSLGGGGMYIYYQSTPLVERNFISQNSSSNGAGIGVYFESTPIIRNNLIMGNFSGAGIRIVDSEPEIINNNIGYNEKDGIQYENNASPVITNNIITSNGGKGINASSTTGTIKYNDVWEHINGNYSSLIGDLTGLNGNISTAPEFIGTDSNEYHLNYFSPCINAGDPNTNVTDVNDFDGQSRLAGQFVDIGADEARPVWNTTRNKQYDDIQTAINDANNNQTIVVITGTHKGTGNKNIDLMGKAVTVQSINPNDFSVVQSTIIDCENNGRAFQFHSGEDANSVIEGISIINGGNISQGGGIHCSGSSPTIKRCIFNNNGCTDYGGAVYCYQSSPVITSCTFTNNTATGADGGAIYCLERSNATVASCIIARNSAADSGGGLSTCRSNPIFINCTVIGNKAPHGGGINSLNQGNPLVANCIVRNNTAADGNQLTFINTEITVSHCDIQDGQAGIYADPNTVLHWRSGNIDAEPNFVNPGHWNDASTPFDANDDYYVIGNYHLRPDSICINKGDNNFVPVQSATDIDLEPRIFDGTVDIGADEYFINNADFNADGIVNYFDLTYITDDWLTEGNNLPGDLYKDNFIDFADFATFAKNWLWKAGWR